MKIIENTMDFCPYSTKIYNEYFGDLSTVVMDIETDGLNPSNSRVILGGMLKFKHQRAETIQFFAEKRNDEVNLLKSYCHALADADIIITYNGERFDLPFLAQRLKKNNLQIDIDTVQSFDLYKVLNKYSNLREILPNLKQKNVEKFLGLSSLREDEISGAESVELYLNYLRTGSKDALGKILLHNKDDLTQLASIMRILDKLDLHKIAFNEGFTVAEKEKKIIIKRISMKKNSLEVFAKTRNIPLDYYSFHSAYQAIHKADEKEFTITIPFDSKHNSDYIDLESFSMDFTRLEQFPAFESGYLILKEKGKFNYAEINTALKIVLKGFLRDHML